MAKIGIRTQKKQSTFTLLLSRWRGTKRAGSFFLPFRSPEVSSFTAVALIDFVVCSGDSHSPVEAAGDLSLTNHCHWGSPLYSPPSAQALLVSWPVVKLAVESPDMRKAAEMTNATMILRMFYPPAITPIFKADFCTTLLPTFSPGTTGQLACGKARCRDARHDESRRKHECDNHFTHVSFSL
jgi:hypothetical protein